MKLTAETTIRADLDTVWRRTQTPEEHLRWDARFTDIEYLPARIGAPVRRRFCVEWGVPPRPDPEQPQRFLYATPIGFGRRIEGWGETVGEFMGYEGRFTREA